MIDLTCDTVGGMILTKQTSSDMISDKKLMKKVCTRTESFL